MRAHFGCLATLERDGTRYVQQFANVDGAIEHCDQYGSRIVTISTPDTILRDMQGTRADVNNTPNARSGSGQPADRVQLPEEKMLGTKKRMDLLVRSWEDAA